MNTTFAGKEAVPTEPGAIVNNLKPVPVRIQGVAKWSRNVQEKSFPGSLALVNVVFGTAALARALAKEHDPHGSTEPVIVQFWQTAIAFTLRVSG